MLLGQPAPLFVRRGRSIRYRFSDVLEWLEDADVVNNTAKASMTNRGNTAPPYNARGRARWRIRLALPASVLTARCHLLTFVT